MKLRTPIVSVFIPTRNRAHMLWDSIDSVLRQTFEDFELIISDNASADATESVVRSFDDSRIRYVRNDHDIGLRENWNRCFALAKGEYIAAFPDDDVMLPENLARKVDVLSSSPGVGLVHSKFDIMDVDGQILRRNAHLGPGPDRTTDCLESRVEILAAERDGIHTSTVLFKKACYDRLGQFTSKLNDVFDWEYWMRIAVYYDVAFLATSLIRWRVHDDQAYLQHFGDDEYLKLREDMKAKRLITRNHLGRIRGGRRIKKQIWKNMGRRFESVADGMQRDGRSKAWVRNLVFGICLEFPELLRVDSLWKVLLKSVLGRRSVMALKRLYALVGSESITS